MTTKAQIFIGEDLFAELAQFLAQPFASCFVLADENTLKYCYPLVQPISPQHTVIQIASGEQNKTFDTCGHIWAKLTEANAERNSLFINLGGGVIGDMGGFSAACFKRGIPFINIPTTLLSMVDASVGGKTGIDFMGFKNQIGLFQEPVAAFVYTVFLKTLPERELTSGFAEVIKHYLIADKDSFAEIEKSKQPLASFQWPEVVKKNIQIKSAIVEQDPQEKGIRKALNFGHTIGHAVESWFLKNSINPLLHGEAVAVGMLAEGYISMKKGFLLPKELNRIEELIQSYFVLPLIENTSQNQILELIKQDKKNRHYSTQFTLLQGIGNYSINNAVEERLMLDSLKYYNSLLK